MEQAKKILALIGPSLLQETPCLWDRLFRILHDIHCGAMGMDQRSIQRLRRLLGETTLLVADDAPVIRDMMSGILEPLGLHTILQTGDGLEAWGMLTSGKVGMVVADWLMPGMNGLELLRKVRQDEKLAETPFIMVTGVPDKQVVAQALKLKVTDYMTKPIDGSVLKQKVIKALSRKNG